MQITAVVSRHRVLFIFFTKKNIFLALVCHFPHLKRKFHFPPPQVDQQQLRTRNAPVSSIFDISVIFGQFPPKMAFFSSNETQNL